MPEALDALILDLVGWLSRSPRPYAEVMEAWRTSCPRLTVWEDALERGLVRRVRGADGLPMVEATPLGEALLARARATPADNCVSAANL